MRLATDCATLTTTSPIRKESDMSDTEPRFCPALDAPRATRKVVAAIADVVALAIGAGASIAGDGRAGRTAMALVTSLGKPIAIAPADPSIARGVKSVLVPLDGTAASANICWTSCVEAAATSRPAF
jgi:hypothetical protein